MIGPTAKINLKVLVLEGGGELYFGWSKFVTLSNLASFYLNAFIILFIIKLLFICKGWGWESLVPRSKKSRSSFVARSSER